MTDLNHVNDGHTADYLDEQDAAADWTPGGIWTDGFAESYDEWNAIRGNTGLGPGTYTEYLEAIGAHLAELRRGHEATARKLGWIE